MKSTFELQSMQHRDVSFVMEIERAVHEFPWSEQIFHDCIDVGYHCWVLRQAQHVLAFAVFTIAVEECHILNISVAPQSQRQGYGVILLQHLITQAQQNNVKNIFLEVRMSNQAAISLYKKLGFSMISVRKGYYPSQQEREDALVFVLNLQKE